MVWEFVRLKKLLTHYNSDCYVEALDFYNECKDKTLACWLNETNSLTKTNSYAIGLNKNDYDYVFHNYFSGWHEKEIKTLFKKETDKKRISELKEKMMLEEL